MLFSGPTDGPGMNRVTAVGFVLTATGLLGYAAGAAVAYPGRSFSVTAVMVGITLIAIRSFRDAGGSVE